MGRPAKFSREQLQKVALTLVDTHGVAGLSMRAVAEALGTGPMTLYNYVADRAELEVLVVEAVLGEARWPAGEEADWRDDVEKVATAMWRAVRAHPHVIPLVVTRRSRSRIVFDLAEALLAGLGRSGRSGHSLLVAFRAVQSYVAGFAQVELAGPLADAASEPAPQVIARFRALPVEQYPHLVDVAKAASTSKPEVEFQQGLRALLAGLASGHEASPPAPPRPRRPGPRSRRRA